MVNEVVNPTTLAVMAEIFKTLYSDTSSFSIPSWNLKVESGNAKGGSITVLLTSCLTG